MLNKLFDLVQQDKALKGKVKFLAVGQGNEENAVKMWKVFHKIQFPQIPDPKSTYGDAINFHPYPVTLLLDKSGKVLVAHIGTFDSAEEVLKEIKAAVK